MATIGSLSVKVDAVITGLEKGLATAGKHVSDFEQKISPLTEKLRVIGPLAITTGAAFAVGMAKAIADTADELAKLSARTGITVEDLSRLQYAAGLSGVSNEALTASIERLSRGMAEAASGVGTAGQAFTAMGISVKNQDGSLRSQNEVLGEIADKFAGYKDGAEKSALAQQIFGKSGAQLIPMINGGAQALKDMADESDRLGNTLTTQTAKAAERMNDNLTRIQTAAGGVAQTISGPLIQSLADLSDAYIKSERSAKDLQSITNGVKSGMTGLAVVLETIAVLGVNTAYVFQSIGREIGAAGAQLALFAQGEFKAGLNIGKMLEEDSIAARAEVDRLTTAILNLRNSTGATTETGEVPTQNDGPKKGNAPVVDVEGKKKADAEAKEKADELKRIKEHELAKVQAFIDALKLKEEARVAATQTEQEKEKERYLLEQEELLKALSLGVITKGEYQLLEQEALMRHREAMADIDIAYLDAQKQRDQQAAAERLRLAEQTASKEMQLAAKKIMSMTSAAASGSKTMFNINKAASIANALLSARESVTSSYAFGAKIGGPKLGAAFAAVAIAATAAQVRQLSSTSFNSGASAAGSVSASAGGGAGGVVPSETPAAQPVSTATGPQPQTVTIQLQGEMFGREQVRSLITQINEAVSDGSVLRIA